MVKKYKNIKEYIKNSKTSQGFKKEVVEYIEDRSLSKVLSVLRHKGKLTQKQIAKKIGCSQSKISKIESSLDKEIAIGDLTAYANVLKLSLHLRWETKQTTIADRIKYHYCKLREDLEKALDISKGDPDLEKAAYKLFGAASFNISDLLIALCDKVNEFETLNPEQPSVIVEELEEVPCNALTEKVPS